MWPTKLLGENMKFCEDCKYCSTSLFGYEFAECHSPLRRVGDINVVTGKVTLVYKYARVNRIQGKGDCGPEARFFEPKPPSFWKKLFK